MIRFYLNHPGNLEEVASELFGCLGISQFLEGDSANVAGGQYFSHTVFGVEVKVEINSYDQEDEYGYMVSVSKDTVSGILVDDSVIKKV